MVKWGCGHFRSVEKFQVSYYCCWMYGMDKGLVIRHGSMMDIPQAASRELNRNLCTLLNSGAWDYHTGIILEH